MKKYRFIVGLLLLSFVSAGMAFAFDLNVPENSVRKVAPQAAIGGTWNATGQWFGGGSWEFAWTIDQRGPFFQVSSTSGASGSGITLGPVMIFKFSGGCEPVYIGFVSGSSMGGMMRCTSGEGSGTWEATKMSFSGQPEPQEDDLNYDIATEVNPEVE